MQQHRNRPSLSLWPPLSSWLVGGPLFTVLFRKVLRVLHELLSVLEVLLGQVTPERVLGLGLVDQGDQRLDDL